MAVRMLVMKEYNVFDADFRIIGVVEALSADAALRLAKQKFSFAVGLMVEPK